MRVEKVKELEIKKDCMKICYSLKYSQIKSVKKMWFLKHKYKN